MRTSNEPGRLVQKENWGILQQGTCDSDALLLTPAQSDTALADLGVVAVWEAHDAVMNLRSLGGSNNLFLAGTELAVTVGIA